MKSLHVFVRSPYNYDSTRASRDSGLRCLDESKTIQSQANDADINVIVKRFGLTGVLPQGKRLPSYGDFEGIFDYADALKAVREADETFMAIPADIRAKFDNDAGMFVAFCSNPDNLPELRKMGLATPEVIIANPIAKAEDKAK